MKSLITIIVLLIASNGFAQQTSTWSKWEWLMGEWNGEGKGSPGTGSGSFSFKTELEGKILKRKSKSEYATGENKTKNVHEDLMIIYCDESENPTKAIYFDNEGHTIIYDIAYANYTIILTSEKQKDSPQFRLTYSSIDANKVQTVFEISTDGKDFKAYIEGISVKKKKK